MIKTNGYSYVAMVPVELDMIGIVRFEDKGDPVKPCVCS